MQIALSSSSHIKRVALTTVLSKLRSIPNFTLILVDVTNKSIPPQPVNSGAKCAKLRSDYVRAQNNITFDLLVSIESEVVDEGGDLCYDICQVRIEDQSENSYIASSNKIYFNRKYFDKTKSATWSNDDGMGKTIGETMAEEFPDIDPKNWMKFELFGATDRKHQIEDALMAAFIKYEKSLLKSAIIKVKDFPKAGVIFQDLSNILVNPILLQILVNQMKIMVLNNLSIINLKIMGLDARGFIYGSMLAKELKCGFIMARKKGKLPGKTIEVNYGTEYSQACIEIMPHLINPGNNILVVDDLVATGGSLIAAIELIKKCNGNPVGCLTILQVDALVQEAKNKILPVPLYVVCDE